MALPDHLQGLLEPESYPHPCTHIELIETHISWVLLTGEYAYKLKKPVRFNFVDFSTVELRSHFCREEVRCNRAFAPDLYIGVAAVCRRPDGVRVLADAAPEPDEYLELAVRMRQFDPAFGLDRLLERGELAEDALDVFGGDLAERHALLPVHRGTPDEVPARMFGPVEDNFEEIGHTALARKYQGAVTRALASARQTAEALRPLFDARMTGGAVRECHGDLHLANLALIGDTVTAFDCLEFNENLRWIDTISDVAFLFMDCHFRDETALAYRFLDGYLGRSGDYQGVRLLPYFAAYRSVVRAKVAALRWVQAPDAEGERRFAAHIDWADRWLVRPPGRLVLTCGLSGSGKSYLAARLLARMPAIRLRSDVARKTLAGFGVLESSGSGIDTGLYDAKKSDETFDHLLETAGALILAGEHVIVDATFIEKSRRDRFVALAEGLGSRAVILLCQAPIPLLETRLDARAAKGADPSEADVAVLRWQQERFEPPTAEEPVLPVNTSEPLEDSRLIELALSLLSDQTFP
jgi:aminoglycoside phosphotransferase family enzyme/predicted kinase